MQRPPQAALANKATEAELQQQIHNLKSELNFQMNASNIISISQDTRLSKELSICMKKLGIQKLDTIIAQEQTVYQQTDLAYLSPLFVIYEEHIKNYDEMLSQLMDDLNGMDQRIQIVNEENQYLRLQLQEKDEQLLKIYKNGDNGGTMKNLFGQLEKDDLEERIRLLNEENSIYIEKLRSYESSIYEYQSRCDIMNRNEQNYVTQIRDLQSQCKQSDIQLDDLKIQVDVLNNKLKNQIVLVSSSDEDKHEQMQRLGKSENECKLLRHQLHNLKLNFESVQQKFVVQKLELEKEIEELHQKEREYFDKQVYNEREIDQLREECRLVKKELDQTKNNLEQTIKMMENYDRKVMVLEKKEENFKQLLQQCKADKENAIMEKERYQLREQQYDQSVNVLVQRHREEIVQLKESTINNNDQIKGRYKMIIDQKDDDIRRLQDETHQLTIQNERLSKENRSMKQELTRMEGSLKQDIEISHQQSDDLHRQINEYQEKIQLLEQKILDQENDYSTLKQQNETQSRTLQNNNADLRQALEHTRSALTSSTQELSSLKSKYNQIGRSNQNLIEELQKTKKHYEQRLEQIQDEYTYKIKNLQMQMEESLKREKTSRDRSVQLLQQYDQIEEKLKSEYMNRIQDLEVTIQNLKSMNHQLTLKYIIIILYLDYMKQKIVHNYKKAQ